MNRRHGRATWPAVGLLAAVLAGCGPDGIDFKGEPPAPPQPLPSPINLLLPQNIRLHPFTGTRTFHEDGGVRGIDARVEATDAFGDATKAFGTFRFELYAFRPVHPDQRGSLIHSWDVPLTDPDKNMLHWDRITRTYGFKLQWEQAIPVGQRFVLTAVYDSPFTQRMFAQRVFVSGE